MVKIIIRLSGALAMTVWTVLTLASCTVSKNVPQDRVSQPLKAFHCVRPSFLQTGDTVALISPSYHTAMENVTKTIVVLKGWGLVPVVGPHVGKIHAGKYAGTVKERLSDMRWALNNPNIKAIICNRGGYGTIHLVNQLRLEELSAHPKWLVGYSDITTLLEMEACAGVMSIHGAMSSHLANNSSDTTSTLMRDLLFGQVPCYRLPAHPLNKDGYAKGVLVGGNLSTIAPITGSEADATAHQDIILFIEEVEETMHNIDRLFNLLQLRGVMSRCRGVILGEFTDCGADLDYKDVETMLSKYLSKYNIPVLCGFPAGHDKVNLPLVMGAPVTLDVNKKGATLRFDIKGEQRRVQTEDIMNQAER